MLKNLDTILSCFLIQHGIKRRDFCKNNNIDISTLKNWLTRKTLPRVDCAFLLEKITNGAILASDFCTNSISSDKSNNNNQNLNVKNTTPSVSSDDKQIDVVEATETQSSEPSEVAKSKVGGK